MQVRIALTLCVVLCGAFCGHSLTVAQRQRAALLRALTEGLRVLKIHMTGMFEPIQDALGHSDCTLLRSVSSQMSEGVSAWAAWQAVRKSGRGRRGSSVGALEESDCVVLDRFFERLGESGREEQELLLEGTVQALEVQCEKAEKKSAEADRLYLKLGLLVGLMLALIVI